MPKLETLLADGLRSELILQQQLKALSEALRQQLQETETRQEEELERRIHRNSLLSAESGDQNKLEHQAKRVGMRRSTSTSALTSDKKSLQRPRQSESPELSSPVWVSSKWKSCPDRASTLTPARTQQCEQSASSKTTQSRKEEEAETECQRKFCAHPVPGHVNQPLYQKMMELREKERNQGREQRRDFLLSIQKPFRFQEREKEKKEKKEKLITTFNQVSHKNKAATVKKPPQKEVKDASRSELKDQELCSRVSTLTTARRMNPPVSGGPKPGAAERTRKEKLGFLDERPSFQPRIIHQVPDFSRLHKALQTEALRKSQSKDVIKCQPFYLRTSALPARRSRMSPEHPQVPKISNVSRSKSLGALTSLSADTLPTYITDAERKRRSAIRKSMETRDSKNQESADWLKKYNVRSQAMKKTLTLHARLLDPHSSLKDVYDDKLQHHREADQLRRREYTKALRDMKARVGDRPFLFEQVKQKNAKDQAEQTYRDKLKKAGLKELFVEENGEGSSSSSPFSSEEAPDENHSSEDHIYGREENVDDGEKIEDVEEKSVKSKGEETP